MINPNYCSLCEYYKYEYYNKLYKDVQNVSVSVCAFACLYVVVFSFGVRSKLLL